MNYEKMTEVVKFITSPFEEGDAFSSEYFKKEYNHIDIYEEKFNKFLNKFGVVLNFIQFPNSPHWVTGTNNIYAIPKKHFKKLENYYHMLFHEFCHWTKTHIDRPFPQTEEVDKDYILEEVTVTIAATLLGIYLNIKPELETPKWYIFAFNAFFNKDKHNYEKLIKEATQQALDIINWVKKVAPIPLLPITLSTNPIAHDHNHLAHRSV